MVWHFNLTFLRIPTTKKLIPKISLHLNVENFDKNIVLAENIDNEKKSVVCITDNLNVQHFHPNKHHFSNDANNFTAAEYVCKRKKKSI